MIRCVCSLFFLALAPFVNAQKNPYVYDYIVDQKNDTIHGKVSDIYIDGIKIEKIKFVDANGKKDKFKPGEIKGYSSRDYLYRSILCNGKLRFAQVIVDGPLVLYYDAFQTFGKNDPDTWFIQKYGEEPSLKIIRRGRFADDVIPFIKDNYDLVQKVQSGQIDYDHLTLLIQKYNSDVVSGK